MSKEHWRSAWAAYEAASGMAREHRNLGRECGWRPAETLARTTIGWNLSQLVQGWQVDLLRLDGRQA
jgi:hypothetical protein